MSDLRIVVTGGRRYARADVVARVLGILSPYRVAQGGAPGADSLARAWCKERDVSCPTYPADWGQYGDGAGPKRNREMLRAERPDLVVAFPGGSGTFNCVRLARDANILVLEVHDFPLIERIREGSAT